MKAELKIGIVGILSILLLIWGISFLKGNDILVKSNNYYSIYKNIEENQQAVIIQKEFEGVSDDWEVFFTLVASS